MLVFQNSLITIHYSADNDVLAVDWPDFDIVSHYGIRESLDKIIECIRSYDASNLLIDTSRSRVNLPPEEYEAQITEFAAKLRQTRLKRFARVITGDASKEEKVKAVRQRYIPPYQFQDFRTKDEGLRWLTTQNQKDRVKPDA